MNHQEAEALCERLAREDPERDSHKWLPRQGDDGEWSVVKVRMPDGLRRDPTKATIESKPKPPEADDPRGGGVGSPWPTGS
jgi:hypothetical protein